MGSNDLIYQTVSYISANFKKKLSLEEMAKDLGVSKYVLSRLFSKTFHRNFNQYLNDARLNYACHRLENTSDSITNICLDSGFESQRTFNRVFKERYKISPSDYRSTCVKDICHKRLTKATNLVLKGAKLIGANSDVSGPIENGIAPACRALVAPIEMASLIFEDLTDAIGT